MFVIVYYFSSLILNDNILFFPGEGTYKGSTINGLRHGHGVQKYAEDNEHDRISYDGEWNDDKRSGKGTMIWKGGEMYVGDWLNDLRHGNGAVFQLAFISRLVLQQHKKQDRRQAALFTGPLHRVHCTATPCSLQRYAAYTAAAFSTLHPPSTPIA